MPQKDMLAIMGEIEIMGVVMISYLYITITRILPQVSYAYATRITKQQQQKQEKQEKINGYIIKQREMIEKIKGYKAKQEKGEWIHH